jgi:hypothetical protein
MRYTRIALLSAAATCLLAFATPSIAALGRPSGCLSCEPVEVPGPTPDYDQQGAPVTGSAPSMSGPPAATAPTPDDGRHWRPRAKRRHMNVWNETHVDSPCQKSVCHG